MPATRWFDIFIQDIRYGARELLRHPGFALTAIVSLSLGIMAATPMYSVILVLSLTGMSTTSSVLCCARPTGKVPAAAHLDE